MTRDLTSLYQRQGHYLVRAIIPKQAFDGSEVKMLLLEGKVEGAEHYDPEFIRRRFEAAIENDTFRSEAFTRSLSHKDIANNFFGGRVPFSHDKYTMARLAYGADWRGPSGRTIVQASVAQGLGGTGASDPLVSRVGASAGFTRFNLDAARVHRLSDGLYGVLRGSAQWSTTPLFVAEQFALGGPDTVRGYQQAELLGDRAYLMGAELRWSPDLENPDKFQFVFFVDHGGVSLVQPQPGDLSNGNTLTGAGLGFRWGVFDKTNLLFDLGFPLRDKPQGGGRSPAVYTGLQTQF